MVGVIANLALFFAVHTPFGAVDDGRRYGWLRADVPHWSTISPRALAVGASAFWLVFRRRLGVLPTLGICTVAGAIRHLVGRAV